MLREKMVRKLRGIADIIENPLLLKVKIFGLDMHFASNCLKIKTLLGKEPNTVLDIGAYQGLYSATASYVFPKAKIYAFEPINESYRKIVQLQKKFPNIIAINSAVSEISGKIEFQKNRYLPSSSYKPMLKRHKNEFPFTKNESVIKVNSMRLDQFLEDKKLKRPIFMKIDVQGAELDVLKSLSNYIKNIDAIMVEISLVKLYKDAPTFDDINSYLKSTGMNFVDVVDKLFSPQNKKIVQFNTIFIRNYD